MDNFSLSLSLEIVKLLKELSNWGPISIFKQARELSYDPKVAVPYFLSFLARSSRWRHQKYIVESLDYLFEYWLDREAISEDKLLLLGRAQRSNGSVILLNDENLGSQAIVDRSVGNSLLWGLRFRLMIEGGTEAKLEIGKLIFAINTEDYPRPEKTKVFTWDHTNNTFEQILQISNLVIHRKHTVLVSFFLWDKTIWLVSDDHLVFKLVIDSKTRQDWLKAKPVFNSWNSRIRVSDISVYSQPKVLNTVGTTLLS
jgi:hypothetical protein